MHIIHIPTWVRGIVGMEELVTPADSGPPPAGAGSTEELLKFFDDNVKEALRVSKTPPTIPLPRTGG